MSESVEIKATEITAIPVHGGHAQPKIGSPKPSFTSEVTKQLGFYVYRLIDPRNNETFYVGKGQGNRVFDHAAGEAPPFEDRLMAPKLKRLQEIKAAGGEVDYIIHRHGMDEQTALQVEAALIDAFPNLTNAIAGHGSADFGAVRVPEIIARYQAEEAKFDERVILINISRTRGHESLYDATRFAWKIAATKASDASCVLAVDQGLIVEAFIAEKWLPSDSPQFSDFEPVSGRCGFIGHEAPPEIRVRYVGKRVPTSLRKKGAANPIRYAGPWE